MKSKFSKLLVLTLAAAMAFSAVGCGDDDTNSGNAESGADASQSEKAENQTNSDEFVAGMESIKERPPEEKLDIPWAGTTADDIKEVYTGNGEGVRSGEKVIFAVLKDKKVLLIVYVDEDPGYLGAEYGEYKEKSGDSGTVYTITRENEEDNIEITVSGGDSPTITTNAYKDFVCEKVSDKETVVTQISTLAAKGPNLLTGTGEGNI